MMEWTWREEGFIDLRARRSPNGLFTYSHSVEFRLMVCVLYQSFLLFYPVIRESPWDCYIGMCRALMISDGATWCDTFWSDFVRLWSNWKISNATWRASLGVGDAIKSEIKKKTRNFVFLFKFIATVDIPHFVEDEKINSSTTPWWKVLEQKNMKRNYYFLLNWSYD